MRAHKALAIAVVSDAMIRFFLRLVDERVEPRNFAMPGPRPRAGRRESSAHRSVARERPFGGVVEVPLTAVPSADPPTRSTRGEGACGLERSTWVLPRDAASGLPRLPVAARLAEVAIGRALRNRRAARAYVPRPVALVVGEREQDGRDPNGLPSSDAALRDVGDDGRDRAEPRLPLCRGLFGVGPVGVRRHHDGEHRFCEHQAFELQ